MMAFSSRDGSFYLMDLHAGQQGSEIVKDVERDAWTDRDLVQDRFFSNDFVFCFFMFYF